MVVLHDLIFSSRVHQDFVGGVQAYFLLASRSAINSPFSFEVEFCISSFFSPIQTFGCGIISPQVLRRFSISPQQDDSFVVVFSATPLNSSF